MLLVAAAAAVPAIFGQSDVSPVATSKSDALALEQQGSNADAERIWQRIAEEHPKDPEAFAHLGLLESRQENFAAAIENYRKALALGPAVPGIEMNLGLACFKASQFAEAIKAFSAELQGQPPDSPVAGRLITLLGMAHYGMGDYFVAIPYLRKAADEDPQNLPLRLTLAHSCLWSKQYDCVMKVDKEILALNADSAEADMLVGEALDEKGDDAGAMEQFRAATKANPKEPNAHFGLGYLLWKQHHFDEAAPEFQAELENDPSQRQARAYLGDALVELNQYQEALPVLERGEAESSDSAMVHRDLGIVYAEMGRKEDAANELVKAIALDPKDVSPHWRLGKLFQAMGKKDEAKAQFETASAMIHETSRPLTQEIGEPRSKSQP
ncbi:TPR domain protein, putative component of TonB system [Acidisarcina polymorpha]|uniref:TPR domain protein, putative component of TonB system n=1 Tax=Acidisarcina polymorpha TaxID=2211140 RepID=A0A2Z5G553_9BACT|nr:TPR domain protein, putative component of TonB system [Acidisarcina polymorpha]